MLEKADVMLKWFRPPSSAWLKIYDIKCNRNAIRNHAWVSRSPLLRSTGVWERGECENLYGTTCNGATNEFMPFVHVQNILASRANAFNDWTKLQKDFCKSSTPLPLYSSTTRRAQSTYIAKDLQIMLKRAHNQTLKMLETVHPKDV